MSLFSRLRNALRPERLAREIDEELRSHLAEAIENGADPAEARRAFGSPLRHLEASRDIRLTAWLDSLRADTVFAWRQIAKRKITSAAAILSLALGIGSCTAAFRLIDALLLRPLPVAAPQQLYAINRSVVSPSGEAGVYDSLAYPDFRLLRAAAKDQAELIAVSYAEPVDITWRTDEEMEKVHLQYVSGWTFSAFGLSPVAGRLFTENDDSKPGGHPYAVLSWDYWSRRFAADPRIVGRKLRFGNTLYEVVGVGPKPFTGTDRGTVTDVFIPTMMHPGVTKDDWTWLRAIARVKPGVVPEPLRAKLDATSRAFEENRARGFSGMSQRDIAGFVNQKLLLDPEGAASSGLQSFYRRSLEALGLVVLLVLLIACANVANLMTAQAAARAREMALRVSIGAGRARLVQLVLVECALVAILATALGAAFAWWAAPFVVSRINPADNPARLDLPADWRVFAFSAALTALVTVLFGLVPALRASAVRPVNALRGGSDPHKRRRLMHALIAFQVAFCFVVLFVAALFAATSDRLAHRPLGFSSERVLTLDTVSRRARPAEFWDLTADHLRSLPGIESVALSGWALLGGGGWNGFVSVDGAPPGPVLAYFLGISPGWLGAMKISVKEGRDFRASDTFPGSVIVNETFVKQFFNGRNPVGRTIAKGDDRCVIVGVATDAPYRNIRQPIDPVAFVPMHMVTKEGSLRPIAGGTFIVRTRTADPLSLSTMLRREVSAARPELRVSTIRTQAEHVLAQTVRERLLASLGLFFAAVALLLAGIGLYGVLDYSVLQRRREIGIRIAVGASGPGIARLVTLEVLGMIVAGSLAGAALCVALVRSIESLLYGVNPSDPSMFTIPAVIILMAALAAALPAVLRAIRIDPAKMLRAE